MNTYILIETTAFGCSGDDPKTSIRAVGSEQACLDAMRHIGDASGWDVEYDETSARWVDEDEDTVTVLTVQKLPPVER